MVKMMEKLKEIKEVLKSENGKELVREVNLTAGDELDEVVRCRSLAKKGWQEFLETGDPHLIEEAHRRALSLLERFGDCHSTVLTDTTLLSVGERPHYAETFLRELSTTLKACVLNYNRLAEPTQRKMEELLPQILSATPFGSQITGTGIEKIGQLYAVSSIIKHTAVSRGRTIVNLRSLVKDTSFLNHIDWALESPYPDVRESAALFLYGYSSEMLERVDEVPRDALKRVSAILLDYGYPPKVRAKFLPLLEKKKVEFATLPEFGIEGFDIVRGGLPHSYKKEVPEPPRVRKRKSLPKGKSIEFEGREL